MRSIIISSQLFPPSFTLGWRRFPPSLHNSWLWFFIIIKNQLNKVIYLFPEDSLNFTDQPSFLWLFLTLSPPDCLLWRPSPLSSVPRGPQRWSPPPRRPPHCWCLTPWPTTPPASFPPLRSGKRWTLLVILLKSKVNDITMITNHNSVPLLEKRLIKLFGRPE